MKKSKAFIQVLCILGAILIAYAASIVLKQSDRFRYEKELDTVAITIDDAEVTLRELGYYIYVVEEYGNEKAKIYDGEDLLSYWNLHFSAGQDSSFVSEIARETVYKTCICDHVYENMAIQEGYALTTDEIARAAASAQKLWEKLNEYQRTKTGLTLEVITDIEQRKVLAKRYATDYLTKVDLTSYPEDPLVELSADGTFYENIILKKHSVKVNEELKKEIQMGHITINQDIKEYNGMRQNK